MKCVALSADSEKSTPLLATMPIRNPWSLREAADDGRRVALLELVEARTVHQPGDHLTHVVRLAQIEIDDAVELGRIVRGVLRGRHVRGQLLGRIERRDDHPRLMQRMLVVFGEIVRDARQPRVDVGAAEILGRHIFSGGGLHQRRAAEKDRSRALDDDGFVRHGGHVGAAGGARAHDDRHLRNAERPTCAPD